jgi:hypothetical protein
VYAGVASDDSLYIGFTKNLSTPATFEQSLNTSSSDSLSMSTLANISTNEDGSNNHGALIAWRDASSEHIHYVTAAITKEQVSLSPVMSLDDSKNIELNSIKVHSTQGSQGPCYTLLWIETDVKARKSLKYASIPAVVSSTNTPSIFTAIRLGSEPMTYVSSEDAEGGLHLLAYSSEKGIYYMNKLASSDSVGNTVRVLPNLKSSSIRSAALATAKEGFASIIIATQDALSGGTHLITLHRYPSQPTPVEQDRQPIATLLEGKHLKLTIDPESNETTTVFIANKDSGKAAIHLYTRKTITVAPKDEMVSLPLDTHPNLTDVDVLISHVDGTREDIVGVSSSTSIPAYIAMRTIKYDFFSKFKQILPADRTSSTTHLHLEPVLGGVVISYLDDSGALSLSTISVPMGCPAAS